MIRLYLDSKQIMAYTISYVFLTYVLVYVFKIPNLILDNNKLVKEYYGDKMVNSFIFDYILIFFYIIVMEVIVTYKDITEFTKKLIVLVVVILCISGSAMYYFLSRKMTNSFFTRYFHYVKGRGLLYDMLLVTLIYIGYYIISEQLYKY